MRARWTLCYFAPHATTRESCDHDCNQPPKSWHPTSFLRGPHGGSAWPVVRARSALTGSFRGSDLLKMLTPTRFPARKFLSLPKNERGNFGANVEIAAPRADPPPPPRPTLPTWPPRPACPPRPRCSWVCCLRALPVVSLLRVLGLARRWWRGLSAPRPSARSPRYHHRWHFPTR
jgi:hypothetical protein